MKLLRNEKVQRTSALCMLISLVFTFVITPASYATPSNSEATDFSWKEIIFFFQQIPAFKDFRLEEQLSSDGKLLLMIYDRSNILVQYAEYDKSSKDKSIRVFDGDNNFIGSLIFDPITKSLSAYDSDGMRTYAFYINDMYEQSDRVDIVMHDYINNKDTKMVSDNTSIVIYNDDIKTLEYSLTDKSLSQMSDSINAMRTNSLGEKLPLSIMFNKKAISGGANASPLAEVLLLALAYNISVIATGLSTAFVAIINAIIEQIFQIVDNFDESTEPARTEIEKSECQRRNSDTLSCYWGEADKECHCEHINPCQEGAIKTNDPGHSIVDIDTGICYQTFKLPGYVTWAGFYAPSLSYSVDSAKELSTISDITYIEQPSIGYGCSKEGEGFGNSLCYTNSLFNTKEIAMPTRFTWQVTVYNDRGQTVGNHTSFINLSSAPGFVNRTYVWYPPWHSKGTGIYRYEINKTFRYEYDGNIVNKPVASYTRQVLLVNNSESPFGAGWWPTDLPRIYEDRTDNSTEKGLMYVSGAGSRYLITNSDTGELSPPNGVTSTFYRNGDSTIFMNTERGEILEFHKHIPSGTTFNDFLYNLVKKTEQNGHITEYEYVDDSHSVNELLPKAIHDHITSSTIVDTVFNYNPDHLLESVVTTYPGSSPLTTTFQHDENRNLTRINTPDGRGVSYQYQDHKIVKKDFINGNFSNGDYTEYEYNSDGRVSKITKPDRRQVYTYLPAEATNANSTQKNEYTEISVVSRKSDNYVYENNFTKMFRKETDPYGRVTLAEKDDLWKDVTVTYPSGLKEINNWTNDRVTSKTFKNDSDQILFQVGFSYKTPVSDKPNYKKIGSIQVPSVPTANFNYNVNGFLTDAFSGTYNIHIDYYGGEFSLPQSVVKQSTNGDAVSETNSYTYDANGNLMTVTNSLGTVIYGNYEKGRPRRITDGRNGETLVTYDAAGRIKSIRDPSGRTSCRWYDEYGFASYYSYPKVGLSCDGQVPSTSVPSYFFDYDAMKRIVQYKDPSGKSKFYNYNEKGLIDTVQDRNNKFFKFNYDSHDQLSSISSGNTSLANFTHFSSSDLLQSASTASANYSMDYDQMGRMTSFKVSPIYSGIDTELPPVDLTYQYDTANRMTYGAGDTYIYNSASGMLDEIIDQHNNVIAFDYDGMYRVKDYEVKDNIGIIRKKGSLTYNSAGLISNLKSGVSSGFDIFEMNIPDYDANGNINKISVSSLSGNVTTGDYQYEYDALDRITKVTAPNGGIDEYWYDERGNVSDTGSFENGSAKEVYDPVTNHLVQDENCTYKYDNNGNETEKDCLADPLTGAPSLTPIKFKYQYNLQNNLVQISVYNKNSILGLLYILQYGYDAFGRRVWRKKSGGNGNGAVEKYLYNGDNVLYEYDKNNNMTAEYMTTGLDGIQYVIRGGQKYYYHTDYLGSVRAITDEDGDVVNYYEYDAWGKQTRSCPSEAAGKPCIPNRYTYTGREWDFEAGLYYYRSRWYDPDIQRFTQEDPVKHLNPYMFVLNNPVKYLDPDGLDIRAGTPEDLPWYPPGHDESTWEWHPNKKYNPDKPGKARPGRYTDPEGNSWQWDPDNGGKDGKGQHGNTPHWDKDPPGGDKGDRERYLPDGTPLGDAEEAPNDDGVSNKFTDDGVTNLFYVDPDKYPKWLWTIIVALLPLAISPTTSGGACY